jgi:nucleoid-associated protein YgaU
MALQDKYKTVVEYAKANHVSNLQVREQDNVLYIDGIAPTESVKDQLWDLYQKIDPDMRGGDLVMNIRVVSDQAATSTIETYTVKAGDSLSKIAANYPGISWKAIYEANKDQISNPDLIHPGQVLKIPSK